MTAILRISVVILCLLFAVPVYSADYYLRDCDGDSSCGTGAGTSWSNPFDTSAAAETAIQTAGRSATGDTLWVADGAYGATTWNVPTSGTARITIKKATAASHGTETGWDNAYGNGQAVFTGIQSFRTPYWTFDGVDRTTTTSGHGIKLIGPVGANTIALDVYGTAGSMEFRYLEITSPNVPLTYDCVRTATCTTSGLYLRDGANNILFEYGYVHDLALPLMVLGNDDVIYRHNYVQRNESTTTGDPEPVTHSEFASVSFGVSSNLQIYSNTFEDIEGTAIVAIMNAAHLTGLWFFNNVAFYTPTASPQTGLSNGVVRCTNTSTECHDFSIYNNTFVDIPMTSRVSYSTAAAALSNWIVKNNLWFCSDSCGSANNDVNAQITYDDNWYGGITFTAAENGAINGGSEDPFTNAATYDFTLKEGAGPVGVGSDLALVTPFSVYGTADYAGNVRSAPWDIGAYKYGEAAPDTTPPTIASATINTAGDTLTLVFSEVVTVNTSTGFTLEMSGGAAGLTYTSGSGTNTLVYSITGRNIDDDETGTLDYATVANGIEDAAGNDLASTGESDIAVTNNSTCSPSATTYTVTIQSSGNCIVSPLQNKIIVSGETASYTCAASGNSGCAAWTGTCGGSGTTSFTSSAVTGNCTVIQSCYKISPDVTIGTGAAVTIGSGANGTLY